MSCQTCKAVKFAIASARGDLGDARAKLQRVAAHRLDMQRDYRARIAEAKAKLREEKRHLADHQQAEHGGATNRFGKKVDDWQRRELLAMVRDGVPYREIAEAFGVTPTAVGYHALRAGLGKQDTPTAPTAPPSLPRLVWDVPEWFDDALCAQTDPESFFPEKGGSTREAKRVCATCPVRALCLQYAVEHNERFGIWGGVSERDRRKLKKGRAS